MLSSWALTHLLSVGRAASLGAAKRLLDMPWLESSAWIFQRAPNCPFSLPDVATMMGPDYCPTHFGRRRSPLVSVVDWTRAGVLLALPNHGGNIPIIILVGE